MWLCLAVFLGETQETFTRACPYVQISMRLQVVHVVGAWPAHVPAIASLVPRS